MPGISTCSADIIDHILTCLPDFKTFLSLVTTTKIFNTTFQARPHSIIRAIAYNEVGHALPQALRLVRCEAGHFHDADLSDLPEEKTAMNTPIQPEEACALVKNAKVAHSLEDLFSWRCKDRSSQASKLTPSESYKFRVALYRFWLYSAIYGAQAVHEIIDDSDYDSDEEETEDVAVKRQCFLGSFTGHELDEIERVSKFLRDTANWAIRAKWKQAPTNMLSNLAICCGPPIILQCYEGFTISPLTETEWKWDYSDHEGTFLSDPLDIIREDRKQDSQQSSVCDGKVILSEVIGEDDTCQYCGARKGLELWNKSNWNYLVGILNATIHHRLPGRLPSNASETIPLRSTLEEMQYSVFMTSIFSQKMAPYDQLSEQDWLCLDCLDEFFRHHLVQWWLDHKRQADPNILEDCWYGWNCRTMVHNGAHAKKLNHLCMPTRGS